MKMKKNIKFLSNKLFVMFLIAGLLLQTIVPTMVVAGTVNIQDGDSIEIGGSPTINGNTFEYDHGDVTVLLNDSNINTTSFDVDPGDEVSITLNADDGYTGYLYDNNGDYNVNMQGDTYTFVIHDDAVAIAGKTLSFTPSFSLGQEPTVEAMKFDFTINGESFTNVTMGDKIAVPEDFNMDSITEFYITKIAIEGDRTYTYAENEYSYALRDAQGRRIFDTHYNKISNNIAILRVDPHPDDMLDSDIDPEKTRDDYFGFYITGIFFTKPEFKGVEFSTENMPDNYDFTVWNGADLSSTTPTNLGVVTAYYGENTIDLQSAVSSGIADIKLMENSGIPNSAISINNETNEVTILSNYYNEIPLQIELDDGTVGYIKINRIGIFVGSIDAGNDTFFHGASAMISGNLNVATDKHRIAAVFYHEDTTSFNDYDLIANLTYANGDTETVIAQGVGDIHNSRGNIIGSDYILWKGNSVEDSPKTVSVIAVEKGAITNETEFGGATFGSGAGVVWNRR